jgi:hypothetical protein
VRLVRDVLLVLYAPSMVALVLYTLYWVLERHGGWLLGALIALELFHAHLERWEEEDAERRRAGSGQVPGAGRSGL